MRGEPNDKPVRYRAAVEERTDLVEKQLSGLNAALTALIAKAIELDKQIAKNAIATGRKK